MELSKNLNITKLSFNRMKSISFFAVFLVLFACKNVTTRNEVESKLKKSMAEYLYKSVNNEQRFDANLSNKYINDYIYQRTGLTYRINKKEWNFSTGLQYQRSDLNGQLISRDTVIEKYYNFGLPNLRFEYSPVQGKRMTISYETSVREPSISQLQPINDNTNPLYLSKGNSDLIPEYNHRLRLGYNHFNQSTFSAFFSNISA